MSKQLIEIIGASLVELQIHARDFNLDPISKFYAEVLLYFLNFDNLALKEKWDVLRTDSQLQKNLQPYTNDLLTICELRYQLRTEKVTAIYLKKLNEKKLSNIFEAEKYFLMGRSYELLQNEKENIQCALKASALYKKAGCPKKALRALYNSVVAESRLAPYKTYILEYQSIIRLAEETQDTSFCGMSQTMISREYQIIGLLDEAIQLSEQGLKNLSLEKGSFHYFHAILHRASLMIETKNFSEAKKLLAESKLGSFPEIGAARQLLECLIEPTLIWNKDLEQHLLPTWKERLCLIQQKDVEDQATSQLTELELKIVKTLWSGPQSKWEIITKIYGDQDDSAVLENRFKNLIARTKKKLPDTISFNDGRYYIENKAQLNL